MLSASKMAKGIRMYLGIVKGLRIKVKGTEFLLSIK